MSEVSTAIKREDLFRKVIKVSWCWTAFVSLYAVITPIALFDLNAAFWSILLFISVLALPAGMANDRICRAIWGILLLAMTIIYVTLLRAHQAGDGPSLREIELLQVGFPGFIATAGLITGLIRTCVALDSAAEAKRTRRN